MRTALVHDRLTGLGGSERVALVLAKAFKADIYTAKYISEKNYSEFKKFRVQEVNPIPDLPISHVHPLIRMLDAAKFSSLRDLRKYDLLLTSGEWAHFAAKNNPRNLWYCYSPNRALYDLRKKISSRYSVFWRFMFNRWASFWTTRDQKAVKHVCKIATLSKTVALRIKKFYKRDAEIIYPPVELTKFYFRTPEDYYLSVQRLMPEKRVELQLQTFERLPTEKLIIVGKAESNKEYQKKLSRWIERLPNVEWRKEVSDKELKELYARCKATIQTPVDEDFGLIAIESMASGKPCIAVDEGGFRETIIHGKTGLLIKKPYVKNFVDAIKNFEKYDFDPKICQKRAGEFSEKKFVKKIRKIAMEVLSQENVQ